MDIKEPDKKLVWNIIAIRADQKGAIAQALGDLWEPFFIQSKMEINKLNPREPVMFDVMWFKKMGDFGDELTPSSDQARDGKEKPESPSLSLLDA